MSMVGVKVSGGALLRCQTLRAAHSVRPSFEFGCTQSLMCHMAGTGLRASTPVPFIPRFQATRTLGHGAPPVGLNSPLFTELLR